MAAGCLLLSAAAGWATEPPITSLAFSPDGKSIVAVSQAGLHVYNWPELERKRTVELLASNVHSLVFSPQGDRLAVGGGYPSVEGIVEVYSWPDGEPLTTLTGHEDSVLAVAWVDESKLVTASLDREILLWDLQQEAPIQHYSGHSRSVSAVCLLPDGTTLISGGNDQSVRVWNVETGELIRNLSQHTAPVHALAVRPGEAALPMVASAAADRTIRFWQPTIGRMVRYARLESEPLDIVWLGNDTHIAASCVDGRVRVVDADQVQVTQTLPAIDGWAYTLALHPNDGSVAVGGSDGAVRRIDLGRTSP